VRILLDLIKKREKEKLKRIKIQKQIVEITLHPITFMLSPALNLFKKLFILYVRCDRHSIFALPVSTELVVDYLSVIKEPMDFSTIENKLKLHSYSRFSDFKVIHL
jgi:hypothetical protein